MPSIPPSTEAEVREILANAVKPAPRLLMADAFATLGRRSEPQEEDFEVFDQARDGAPAEPLKFE